MEENGKMELKKEQICSYIGNMFGLNNLKCFDVSKPLINMTIAFLRNQIFKTFILNEILFLF